jgi:type IX secretion system PorP/SprF family membrane protein
MKLKNITYVFLLILATLVEERAAAQDLHFSQFYNAPLTINPANTGFMPDADYRVGANYRRQFVSLPVPYKTVSAWGDVQLANDKLYNGWFGAGLVFLGDEAGTGALSSNKIYGSLAYHQVINDQHTISAGFQGGFVQKTIDFSKLTFDNQWNGKFFNVQAPSGESFASPNVRYFDLNAGINFATFINDYSYLNLGVAAQHLNRPKESFFSGVTSTGAKYDTRLAHRYSAFVNGSFRVADNLIINPQFYFTTMAKKSQFNVGVNAEINLATVEGEQSELIVGAYYRIGDAIAPMLGIKHRSMQVAFTYDATASKLTKFNSMRGGSEISIIHTGLIPTRSPKQTRCGLPKF